MVRGTNGFLIMFNNDHSIADVTKLFQRPQQLGVIPGMQPDGRFVEHIKNTHQLRPDLGGKADTLCFTTGKRNSRTGKGQIIKPYIEEKFKPGDDFLENLFRNHTLFPGQRAAVIFQFMHPFQRTGNRPVCHFDDILSVYSHRESFRTQAFSSAYFTRDLPHVCGNRIFHIIGIRFVVTPLQVRYDPLKRRGV